MNRRSFACRVLGALLAPLGVGGVFAVGEEEITIGACERVSGVSEACCSCCDYEPVEYTITIDGMPCGSMGPRAKAQMLVLKEPPHECVGPIARKQILTLLEVDT